MHFNACCIAATKFLSPEKVTACHKVEKFQLNNRASVMKKSSACAAMAALDCA